MPHEKHNARRRRAWRRWFYFLKSPRQLVFYAGLFGAWFKWGAWDLETNNREWVIGFVLWPRIGAPVGEYIWRFVWSKHLKRPVSKFEEVNRAVETQ